MPTSVLSRCLARLLARGARNSYATRHQSLATQDPNGDQLRALQTQIRNLMRGKTKTKSNFMLDAVYSYPMLTTGKEWKQRLPNMYIWLDYLSIPQPGAGGGQHSDHRQGQQSELVAQLTAAVNSIPSYIARSSMMWIAVWKSTSELE